MEKIKRVKLTVVGVILGLIFVLTYFFSGCCRPALHRPVAYDGSYKGRVVDMQTGAPVEGVVITAVWYYACRSAGGINHGFYDAYETVTNEHGDFFIPGKGLRLFVDLEPARAAIFKAGYEYYYMWWNALDEVKMYTRTFQWDGDRLIIPLRQLTDEERLRSRPPSRPGIPPHKMKLLTKEVNKVRVERGAPPLPIGEKRRWYE